MTTPRRRVPPPTRDAIGAATVRERERFLYLTPLPYGRGSDGLPSNTTSAIAAVSTRRIVGPNPTTSHPAARPASSSSSVNPPSGPTAATTSPHAPPVRRAARMGQHFAARQVVAPQKVRPIGQRPDAHEDVAAALLTGLDDVALQLIQLRVMRMDHAAPSATA